MRVRNTGSPAHEKAVFLHDEVLLSSLNDVEPVALPLDSHVDARGVAVVADVSIDVVVFDRGVALAVEVA